MPDHEKKDIVFHGRLDDISVPALLLEPESGLVVGANHPAEALLGRSLSTNAKVRYSELVHTTDASEYKEALTTFTDQGYFAEYNAEVIREDGISFPIRVSFSAVLDNGHGLVLAIFRDLTQQKQFEEALLESEERFRRLSNAAFEGICIHENGRILDANEAYASLFGYTPDEIIGMHSLDIVAPESHGLLSKNITSGFEQPYEIVGLKKDGTTFLAEVQGKETRYRGRTVRVSVIQDITRRRQMEDKLRQSEEKLRIMFESISDGIIVLDMNNRIVELNNAAVLLYGYQSKEELIDRNAFELIAEKDRDRAMRGSQLTRETRLKRSGEYSCLKKDGTEFQGEISSANMEDSAKNPSGLVSITRDITERNRLKENQRFYILETMRAQEEERRRVARELHDETIQSLASLSLDIESLLGETTHNLEQIRDKTYGIMKGVRRFCHELRPDILDRLGLIPALELTVSEFEREASIKAQLRVNGEVRRLASEVELGLFRITQEALSNIRKHSSATEASVSIQFQKATVCLSIGDNGRGFELPERLSDLAGEGKLGILGMRDRARLIEANFLLESKIGTGTSMRIEATAA